MFKSLKPPVVIGHRGASLYAPENTLAAFKLAVAQSAAAIEFDVKLTRDRQVVVIHDPKVSRTTDGRGSVSKLSLNEIKRLDAGAWFSSEFKGERIPTLEQAECLSRIYICEAGFSPTSTVARPGTMPRLASVFALSRVSASTSEASAFPSIIVVSSITPCQDKAGTGRTALWPPSAPMISSPHS